MQRIVTIQDISCVGKCSLTVALPIISAIRMVSSLSVPTSGRSTSKHLGPFLFRGIQTSDNANRIVAAARLDDPSVLFGKSRQLGTFVQNLGIGHMLPYKRLLLRAQQGLPGSRPQKRKYGLSRTRPRSKSPDDARDPFLSRLN